MSYQIDTLRKVLTAARPTMTGEQQDADALLAVLTPPMEEPADFPARHPKTTDPQGD